MVLKHFEREFKISQFADDTTIFLKDKFMVDVALKSILTFSKASSVSLIFKKLTCSQSTLGLKHLLPPLVSSEEKFLEITI